MGTEFQVDPDAAAAAKRTGEYGNENPENEEAKVDDDGNPILSEEDPGDDPEDEGGADDDGDPEGESDDDGDDAGDEDDDGDEPTEAVQKFRETAQEWTQEFMDSGELSEDTKATVAKTLFHPDVPKEVIDEMLQIHTAGITAIGVATKASAFEIVGGEENYAAMTEWAKENLPEAETKAFDADVTGTDVSRRDAAIRGLHARMQLATGAEPDREPNLAHDGGRGKGEPIISSRQELSRIQRTERYKKDGAYRDLVERQVRQSMKTGRYRTS